MKHIAATLFLLSVVTTSLAQTTTKIDTAYYDDNYEIVNKSFATYMRIYEKNDDNTSLKHFKDYFVDGNKLSSEGVYLYFKGPGDSHPTVVGKHKKYNKQGVVILDANHDKDGLLDGEYYEYYDNGLVKVHGFYSHDKLDGRVTAFSEKGWMQQYQFIEGEMNPVYTVTSPEGYTNKVHEVDGKAEIYYEDPTDRQLGYSDGTQYQ